MTTDMVFPSGTEQQQRPYTTLVAGYRSEKSLCNGGPLLAFY